MKRHIVQAGKGLLKDSTKNIARNVAKTSHTASSAPLSQVQQTLSGAFVPDMPTYKSTTTPQETKTDIHAPHKERIQQQRMEIAGLEIDAQELKQKLRLQQESLVSYQNIYTKTQQDLDSAGEQLLAQQRRISELSADLEHQRHEKNREKLSGNLAREELEDAQAHLSAQKQQIDELAHQLKRQKDTYTQTAIKIDVMQQEYAQAQSKLSENKRELESLTEELQQQQHNTRQVMSERDKLRDDYLEAQRKILEQQRKIEEINEKLHESRHETRQTQADRELLEKDLESARTFMGDQKRVISSLESTIIDLDEQLRATAKAHADELRGTKQQHADQTMHNTRRQAARDAALRAKMQQQTRQTRTMSSRVGVQAAKAAVNREQKMQDELIREQFMELLAAFDLSIEKASDCVLAFSEHQEQAASDGTTNKQKEEQRAANFEHDKKGNLKVAEDLSHLIESAERFISNNPLALNAKDMKLAKIKIQQATSAHKLSLKTADLAEKQMSRHSARNHRF